MAQIQPVPLSTLRLSELRLQLATALSRLNIPNAGAWLPQENPYLGGGSKAVVDACKAGTAKFNDVAAYLGSSAFAHCADAWSYVGLAADALLKGDLYASVHLAYYAELRAAKSLLATDGLFVGNRYSCALNTNGSYTAISVAPTHEAVWKLLDQWFGQQSSIDAVANVIVPGGENLHSWLGSIQGGITPVLQDMLVGLAFDLRSFSEDRSRRNFASYEPTTLTPSTLGVDTIRQTVSGLWDDIEPAVGGDFPGIDHAIIANILSRQYKAQNEAHDPNDPSRTTVDWTRWTSWIDSLVPVSLNPSALYRALREGPQGSEFQSICGAAFDDTSRLNIPSQFIRPMISRATVLSRLATGLCRQLLTSAGKDGHDLEFWIQMFAVSHGHITDGHLPEQVTDLFGDLEQPRTALVSSDAVNLGELLRDLEDGVALLGQADRVVAWSFA